MRAFDMSIPPGAFVETEHEARQWMNYFLRASKPDMNGALGLDTETSGVVRHRDIPIIWSMSDGRYRICLPAKFLQLYKEPILENPEVNLDFAAAKFDAHMCANVGIDLTKAGEWRDIIPQAWLLNENNIGRLGLKEQTREKFGRVTPEFEETFGKTLKKKGVEVITTSDLIHQALLDPVRRELATDYASLDAYNTTLCRQANDALMAQVEMYPGMDLKTYYYKYEVPFTKCLFRMERRGFTVDYGYLDSLKIPMEAEMRTIEREIARAAGRIVNLNSPIQLRWFFFEFLGKNPMKYTKGGASGNKAPSVDDEVLTEWASQGDPWAVLVKRHRGISKIYGTYVVALMNLLDHNFRVHTSLNQAGTVSGRLSSSDPNCQNIPRPDSDRFKIRESFIAGEGKILVVADYAQLEMRLMAHFSGDPKMVDAINKGIDLHCLTTSEMEGIAYDEVVAAVKAEKNHKKGKLGRELTERELLLNLKRQDNKSTGFGIIYGIGGPGLSRKLTLDSEGKRIVTEQEAWGLIKKWFAVFPTVERYIDYVHDEMARVGYVQTILGRFRRFGDLRGMSRMDAGRAERQGVNSIVQGSASDIAKKAMLKADQDELLRELGAELLLQVHDELVFECPDVPEVVEQVKKRVSEIMEHPFEEDLRVPLPAEAGAGYTWADAK